MKFIISRASIWDDEVQPCKEAVLEKLIATSVYGKEGEAYKKEKNNPNNFNFREENGHFKFDYYKNCWTIEINTLEDLMKLYNKYGDLIIQKHYDIKNMQEIVIYDDYVE